MGRVFFTSYTLPLGPCPDVFSNLTALFKFANYEFKKGKSVEDLPPPNDVSDDENERKGGLNKAAIEDWLTEVSPFLPIGNQPHRFETKLGNG